MGSYAAVLGFLFISGYSMAASFEREPGGFYERRVWRIYPVFLATFAYAQVPVFSPRTFLPNPRWGGF